MAEYQDREHYIPLRKSDLVDMLCKDSRLEPRERDPFRQFCLLVSSVWHFEYLATLEKLKDAYAPFDPDSVTKEVNPLPAEKRPQRMEYLFDEFIKLMERANFKRLSRKDIEDAIEGGASDWGVNMSVDFDVFERIELFVRSEGTTTRVKRRTFLFWKTEEKKVDTYRRLILLVKMRPHKRLPPNIETEAVFAKMFKDIPKLDLEMILPGTKLQMPGFQKWKTGTTLFGSIGYGLYNVGSALWDALMEVIRSAASFTLSAPKMLLLAPMGVLFGYGYKQYAGYQVTKQSYSKMLAESLYFQNLDNNLGVVTSVIDEAEEQECRETILAYYYLWRHAPQEGWSSEQLDDYIEMELEGKLNMKIDFEVGDALGKLEKLNIVSRHGDKYRAVGLTQALEKLDYRWDNYFKYNKA
jgi:hypothetical protein